MRKFAVNKSQFTSLIITLLFLFVEFDYIPLNIASADQVVESEPATAKELLDQFSTVEPISARVIPDSYAIDHCRTKSFFDLSVEEAKDYIEIILNCYCSFNPNWGALIMQFSVAKRRRNLEGYHLFVENLFLKRCRSFL